MLQLCCCCLVCGFCGEFAAAVVGEGGDGENHEEEEEEGGDSGGRELNCHHMIFRRRICRRVDETVLCSSELGLVNISVMTGR